MKVILERERMTATQTQPEVGMGVTFGIGSDCYPYTVLEVVNSKTIRVQSDDYKALPDSEYFGNQKYEYRRNHQGSITTLTLRKNGRWVRKGESMRGASGYWSIGTRRYYSDPHF
jgi:hypothetical protein